MTAFRSLAGELVTGTSSGRTFCLEFEIARPEGFRKFWVPLGLITCRSLGLVTGLEWIDSGPGLDIRIGKEELRDGSAEEPWRAEERPGTVEGSLEPAKVAWTSLYAITNQKRAMPCCLLTHK